MEPCCKALLTILVCLVAVQNVQAFRPGRGLKQLNTSDPIPEDAIACEYAIVGGGPVSPLCPFRCPFTRVLPHRKKASRSLLYKLVTAYKRM